MQNKELASKEISSKKNALSPLSERRFPFLLFRMVIIVILCLALTAFKFLSAEHFAKFRDYVNSTFRAEINIEEYLSQADD